MGDILDRSDCTEMRRVPNEKHIYHLWHEGRVVLAGEGTLIVVFVSGDPSVSLTCAFFISRSCI